jgi:hypothetical protein
MSAAASLEYLRHGVDATESGRSQGVPSDSVIAHAVYLTGVSVAHDHRSRIDPSLRGS